MRRESVLISWIRERPVAKGIRSLGGSGALQRLVKALDADPYLTDFDRFPERFEALELLDAYDLDSLVSPDHAATANSRLFRRAKELRAELEAANFQLYEDIRDAIGRGAGRDALLRWTRDAADETTQATKASADGDSYDYLDELVSGVLRFATPDTPQVDLSAEMVAYQPTPSRHVFELLRKTRLTTQDVLIDLGSGLGHVPLVIAICTDARAIGVELDPSFVACAQKRAQELNLNNATFLAQDVRDAELSLGTAFYLYTPFYGAILRAVLNRLRAEASTRAIRVCTFGPCTPIVAAESWLLLDSQESGHISVFRSRR